MTFKPGYWAERRELYSASFLLIDELRLMARRVLRVSGETTVQELVSIFHGASESDIGRVLSVLVASEHAESLGNYRYRFNKARPPSDDTSEIREEIEVLRRFKKRVLSNATQLPGAEPIDVKKYEVQTDSKDEPFCTGAQIKALVPELQKIALSNSFSGDRGTVDGGTATQAEQCQSAPAAPGSTAMGYLDVNVAPSLGGSFCAKSTRRDTIPETLRVELVINSASSAPQSGVKSLPKRSVGTGPSRDMKDPFEATTAANIRRSAADSGLALNAAAGGLRCSTVEDYIRRASSLHSNPVNRVQPAANAFPEAVGQARYRWKKKEKDSVQRNPVIAVEKYCRLRGLPEPGYSVTYMSQKNVHFCVLQLDNQAFRSYPTLARTHKRAIELAAENAITELGITKKMLDELEERRDRMSPGVSR
ncbi:hypothetical protein BIW11_06364 [Tropilaelaps mercedesae]|uniref:Uncharacterized protein n=1 Tax=Tropilaelaps mercedesae TaxID=418985 RepID=A0A1V9XYE1_9ACAR|nr:hypothetical protein BIW11_06364 [Tropilaelaps mercedesae]